MKEKSPEEVKRAAVAKTTRTLIRLKHSLAADEEINAVLPDTLAQFDEALANNVLKREPRAALDKIIGGRSDAPGD